MGKVIDDSWAWHRAIGKAKLPSTTKTVLWALTNFMDRDGQNCYPSIESIASEAGLSPRAVLTHLKIASDAGFITISMRGLNGQAWARNQYIPTLPESKGGESPSLPQAEGDESDSSPQDKGGACGSLPNPEGDAPASLPLAKGGERDDQKAVNDVHTTYPETYPRSVCEAGAHTCEEKHTQENLNFEFEEKWLEFAVKEIQISQDTAKDMLEKFHRHYAAKGKQVGFVDWRLWVKREIVRPAIASKEGGKQETDPRKRLAQRLGVLAWRRRKGMWIDRKEAEFLEFYEKQQGPVWWDNLTQWEQGQAPPGGEVLMEKRA